MRNGCVIEGDSVMSFLKNCEMRCLEKNQARTATTTPPTKLAIAVGRYPPEGIVLMRNAKKANQVAPVKMLQNKQLTAFE